ncbi:MAG: DUF2493 domain-containing protein [Treponema sp.]|nr:DUF2493 domain-containing protein [Treponema sp.]MCL2277769.1 DUF2493 domain-containing protein [Treponema sp.]
MKKLAIVGSRDFNDYETMKNFIALKLNLDEFDTIVSGGAQGADTLAERFADENNKMKVIFKPDWSRYGDKASFLRNSDIIETADECAAFINNPVSSGTRDSIKKAITKGMPLFIWEKGK